MNSRGKNPDNISVFLILPIHLLVLITIIDLKGLLSPFRFTWAYESRGS